MSFAYLRRIESRIVRELGHSRRSHSDRLRRPKLTLAIHDGAEAYAAGYYQCTRSIHNLKFEWENDQSISMVYRTDQKK